MIKHIKKKYINMVEKYLMFAALKKLNQDNLELSKIKTLSSIKKHIVDLNERSSYKIDMNKWFESTKNKYRLYSSVIRYNETKKIILKYVNMAKSDIIDFGSGNGVFLEFLELNGTGVDINKDCVEYMKNKGIKAFSLEELDESQENKYDHAFAFEVVEHVENQLMVLDNIYKYMKVGGYCFVSIPYVKNSHVLKKQDENTATKRIENYHIYELNTNDFKNLLTHSKFKLLDWEHINPHKLQNSIVGKLLDKFFRAFSPKWTVFILKKET